jgi:hypothetical protein
LPGGLLDQAQAGMLWANAEVEEAASANALVLCHPQRMQGMCKECATICLRSGHQCTVSCCCTNLCLPTAATAWSGLSNACQPTDLHRHRYMCYNTEDAIAGSMPAADVAGCMRSTAHATTTAEVLLPTTALPDGVPIIASILSASALLRCTDALCAKHRPHLRSMRVLPPRRWAATDCSSWRR